MIQILCVFSNIMNFSRFCPVWRVCPNTLLHVQNRYFLFTLLFSSVASPIQTSNGSLLCYFLGVVAFLASLGPSKGSQANGFAPRVAQLPLQVVSPLPAVLIKTWLGFASLLAIQRHPPTEINKKKKKKNRGGVEIIN